MKKVDSLNLIPFIDIMLVLLVIVLTTTSFIEQNRISLDLPKIEERGKSGDLQREDKIISIKNDNKIFLDENEVSLEDLRFHISRLERSASIVINGDKKSNFEAFVQVMAMLEGLGFDNLYILIDKNE